MSPPPYWRGSTEKDKSMKTMLLAAAVLCLGMGAAYADGGDDEGGPIANTFFTELPNEVAVAAGQQPNDVAVNGYVAPPRSTTAVIPPSTSHTGS
jgi:hypothetical protein